MSILFEKYCFKCLSWLFCLNDNCFVEPKMRTLFIAFCWIAWKKGLFYYLFYSWKRLFHHLKEGIVLLFVLQLKETVWSPERRDCFIICFSVERDCLPLLYAYILKGRKERKVLIPKLMKPRLTAEAVTVWKRTMT